MQAFGNAEPFIKKLIVSLLDTEAGDEDDIVQFGIALDGTPAEIDGE